MAKSKGPSIANVNGDVVVQLATRVPKALYRELKLYSVTASVSISELVTEAIQKLLVAKGAGEKPKKKAS
jgi:hypothetical protein